MDTTVQPASKKWYRILLWWEVMRIIYNVIMYFAALASFYVGYVTLPLLYLVIGFLLNVGFSFCWIVELLRKDYIDYSKKPGFSIKLFTGYLLLSVLAVFVFAFFILYQSRNV